MKKILLMIFLCFIIFGYTVMPLAIAKNNDQEKNQNQITGSAADDDDSDDSDDNERDDDSGEFNNDENDTEDDEDEERVTKRHEFKKEFRENGRKVEVERRVETEDGKLKITIIRKIKNADGSESEIKIVIIEEDGKRKVKIEGREDLELETELELDENNESSDLEATTSDGEKHKLKVLPDEARQIIAERLKAMNISNFTLEEIKH
ncbi:MAG: hypothetical protein AABX28_01085, partial [Nanoarchaeota archaeon]